MENEHYDITIRQGRREDMATVHGFIKELAIFEKMEDQFKITVETLIKDGFDTSPPKFNCLVAETTNHEVVGYTLYYTCYSTWIGQYVFLEDLFVHANYRKSGIGRRLFICVAKIAYGLESGRLDFRMVSWNPAASFYNKLGAVNLSETELWHLYRLDKLSLKKLLE